LAETLDTAIGAAIRFRRKHLAMSQVELAEACGVTFQQIQKYERGSNRVSFSRLVLIARALDCRVTDLVGILDTAEGLTPARMDALELIDTPGAVDLLRAFGALPDAGRRPIIQLVQELAGQRGGVKLIATGDGEAVAD
jgi:transcriptional regulator with XRE-family HTH domain